MDEDNVSSDSEAEIRPPNAVFVDPKSFQPIRIHLHRSLGRGGKEAMARKIRAAGGDPTAEENRAEVIICRDDNPVFKKLVHEHDHDRYVWVEAPSWVDICVRSRRYEHFMPGPIGQRNPFTIQDDVHLMEYLALRIPFKDSGGRSGNGVYKDLVDPDRKRRYPWAKRHTWHSWRERYVKNQDVFDPRINRVVKNDPDPPKPGGKGQYRIARRKKRIRLRHTVESEKEPDEQDEVEENDEMEIENIEASKATSQESLNMRDNLQPRKKARMVYDSEDEVDVDQIRNNDSIQLDPNHGRAREEAEEFAMEELILSPDVDHGAPTSSAQTGVVVSSKPKPFPRPRPKNKGISRGPPEGQESEEPQREPQIAPPDTQITLIPSPQPRRPSAHSDVHNDPPINYPNTRSGRRALTSIRQGRGKQREDWSLKLSSQAAKRKSSQELGTIRVSRVAHSPDEVRLEVLPEREDNDQTDKANDHDDRSHSSANSLSSDDAAAERELLTAQRNLLDHGQSSRADSSKNGRLAGSKFSKDPPHIDLRRHVGNGGPSEHKETTTPHNAARASSKKGDTDTTPKALILGRRAKKTAARQIPLISEGSTGRSSEEPTDTTSSFPAEVTMAWEHKTANSSFTPARGTRAAQYAQSTTKKGKGKMV